MVPIMDVAAHMDGQTLIPVLVVTLIYSLAMVIADPVDVMYSVKTLVSLIQHIMIVMVTIWVVQN